MSVDERAPGNNAAGGTHPAGMPPAADPGTVKKGSSGGGLAVFANVVAVVLLIVYLVFLSLQWGNVNAAELTYARRADLVGGLEALAFAAAGAILGTTVQRQVTKKAEDQATAAQGEAEAQRVIAQSNRREAERGRALVGALEAKRGIQPGGPPGLRGPGPGPNSDLEELLALARSYD